MAISQKAESKTRAQIVSPRSTQRASRPKRNNANHGGIRFAEVIDFVRTYAKPFAVGCSALALLLFYYWFTNSPVFQLKGIEVRQASQSVHADIEKIVRAAVGQTRLLDVDLAAIRQKIEALTRVREATVARILPDKVHVNIVEREPAVLVRRNSGLLVWLDKDAVEIGEFSSRQNDRQKIPPTATGFAEGNLTTGAISENRERVAIYKKIEQEFTSENSLWDLVDEIDLASPKYVNLQLLNSPVHVVLGSEDFKNRFKVALQVLQSVKERDAEQLSRLRIQDAERLIEDAERINFLDASKPSHIVFAFSSPKMEKIPDAGTSKKAELTKAPKAVAETPKAVVARPTPRKAAAKPEPRKTNVAKATTARQDKAKLDKRAASANRKVQVSQKQAPGKKR
jgi:hypothetical protein